MERIAHKLNYGAYNHFCWALERLGYKVGRVKSAGGLRHWFYDEQEKLIAYLDERKDYGLLYTYR